MLGKNLYVSTIVRTIKRGRIEEVKETDTTYQFKVEGKKKLYVFEKYDAIIVESFGVGGIPNSIRDKFFDLCQKYNI